MKKVIFMISGLSDVEVAGNQSMKNGIKYLSEFGYKIMVFTFMPKNFSNLQDPQKIFNSNVCFYRLPDCLSKLVNLGRKVKDVLGRRKQIVSLALEANEGPGTYLREYNPIGRIFYLIFLFGLYLPVEFFRVLFFSLKYKPDLIYGVNCQGAIVASLVGRMIDKPNITRYHGISVSEYDLGNWKSRMLVLDEILGLKVKADAIVMTNDGTGGDRILKKLNNDEKKTYFWMNGIEVDDFKLPDDWSPDEFKRGLGFEGKHILLMLTRLAPWKGVDKGVRCVHKLVKDYGVADVILLIVGEGPERGKLVDLAQALEVNESIRFMGAVPHKEITKYYAITDVFLSLYDVSNMGNPVLEAIYFSLPIVSLDDGSAVNLLINGYNSFLPNPATSEDDLPLAIKKIIENGSLKEQMRENVRRTCIEKILSWKQRMELENSLIQKIVKR